MINGMKVLVVVDMQIVYPAAQDADLIRKIEAAAETTIRGGGRVVHLQYDASGMSSVKLPPDSDSIWKCVDGGGDILYAYLVGAHLVMSDSRFVLSGVNLSACVMETAIGLAKRLYEENAMCDHVTIDPDLCGDGARYKVRFANTADHAPLAIASRA